ncbi:hypothetical protein PV325_009566 [Microctonus aethiopoides]|nr:hypothetical protein PV325_009566 [Microctonus aethiopoides]
MIQSLIETAATVPLFCVSAGVDSLFTLYGFQMIGQLREMSYRMTHIDKITDDGTIVRECVLQHFTIMRCRDILQKIYGPPILWVMTTNAIVLCNVIFQFSQMTVISISRMTWISAYVALKIIQTFMYAWTGTCLTTEFDFSILVPIFAIEIDAYRFERALISSNERSLEVNFFGQQTDAFPGYIVAISASENASETIT